MYGNVDANLLWLSILDKYIIKKFDMTRIHSDSCIFYKKDEKGKLELVMSVHVYDVFMAVKPYTLEKLKDFIKLKFNIQESGKV